ncbi:GAF and ANTAR domain-containing protein [Nocardioides sp.]|uniref:GAF and ANTAR domain-containing protein n=1 Tax=Nocardioides sp. TaxID=35761 RepID=UPI0031FEE25F|nr:hypothetical protein [Nocardioides sp.]
MTVSSGSADDVLALIADEPRLPGDQQNAFGGLERLCRAAARALPAMGVGVIVMSKRGEPATVASSGPECEAIQELQFTLGEGPCLDAYALRRPVLTPDLAKAARTRWLGYGPAAQDRGVEAVFAFPLQVGAAQLGAMDVYRDRPGALSLRSLSRALSFADVSVRSLLDSHHPGETDCLPDLDDVLESHFELYQAQGMVMVQLGVDLGEAMSRLRAYAYAQDRQLSDVAVDIVSRKLVFEPDHL